MNITLGFVPPALWLHVNPSLPLHVHQGGLCPPCHELSNRVFKPYSNNSKRSSKSAIPSFGLLSLNTRSIYILISVFFFFLWLSERGKTLVQKKPTMYPEWKSTFDAHIYEGRVIQIVLMKAAEEPLSEVTVGVSVLAERCKKGNGKAEFWVRKKINSSKLLT